MTLSLRNPLPALIAAFAIAAATFALLNRPAADTGPTRTAGANELVLQADKLIQRVRETGDVSYFKHADALLAKARELEPRNSAVYTGLGTIALARHDFAGGLEHGLRARELAPDTAKPLGVVVDGQVELGRYRDAERTLQTMLDEKPNLAAYARASYLRELRGDLPGAVSAMRLAVAASGGPEGAAYVRSLLGDLEFARGRLAAARTAYRQALLRVPGHIAASVGLARVAGARGQYEESVRRVRAVAAVGASPETLVALGEAEHAAGHPQAAATHFDQARAEERKRAARGENTDTELALLEADHGSPALAVELGRRGWRNGPSVRSANALGWALTRAGRPHAGLVWARRALRLGSRDPLFLYHAGIAARNSGNVGAARRWLRASLALNPRFSPLHSPRARRALRQLRGH